MGTVAWTIPVGPMSSQASLQEGCREIRVRGEDVMTEADVRGKNRSEHAMLLALKMDYSHSQGM